MSHPPVPRRRPDRRHVSAGAVLAGALAALATTAPTADAASDDLAIDLPAIPAGTEVDISFESYNFAMAGAGADTMNQLVDEFEAAHPNIHVERRTPTDMANFTASVQQEIVAGDPPSLAQMLFQTDLIVNQLGAPSWDSLLGAEGVDAYFDGRLTGDHPVHDRAAVLGDYGGETYLFPFVFSTPTLFLNRTLFEAAGLDPDAPPATWDEVRAAASAVTEQTEADGIYVQCTGEPTTDWCYQGIVKSNGATPISADLSTLAFDSPEAIEATEMLAGLVSDELFPDVAGADATEAFINGDLAMILTSSVLTGSFLPAAAANGWQLDATGLPAFGDRPVVPTNSGSGLATFATDPLEQRAAFELVTFLTSDHAYSIITSQIGYLPLRTGIVDEPDLLGPWLEEHPFLQDNLDQLDHLEPWLFPPGTEGPQITTIWLDAISQVVFDGADAAATLADAQARATDLMPGN
ncbi:ABC transporter substrate-binding protein [Desertimonas flava]|uniref:ABC transporter substrate-binding protein n=1 Tax=Desertimonas flava TaxID=2064846 RepID=UPI0013C3FC31|nr:ABC transporter substrate-binding protein [Desertimonas flava]